MRRDIAPCKKPHSEVLKMKWWNRQKQQQRRRREMRDKELMRVDNYLPKRKDSGTGKLRLATGLFNGHIGWSRKVIDKSVPQPNRIRKEPPLMKRARRIMFDITHRPEKIGKKAMQRWRDDRDAIATSPELDAAIEAKGTTWQAGTQSFGVRLGALQKSKETIEIAGIEGAIFRTRGRDDGRELRQNI